MYAVRKNIRPATWPVRSIWPGKIIASKLAAFRRYAVRGVLRRTALQWRGARRRAAGATGRPVKVMPGGITGWLDEGFTLVSGA
jgi:rhodanese-related sulfurtransferase